MSEKPGRRWDAASHEALLFAMIEEFRPSKDKIIAIVERMNILGYAYTFHGVKYSAAPHVQCLTFLSRRHFFILLMSPG